MSSFAHKVLCNLSSVQLSIKINWDIQTFTSPEWQYLPCYSFFTHSLVNLKKNVLTYFYFCACVCWVFQSCPTLYCSLDWTVVCQACPWNQEQHLRSGLFFFFLVILENTVFVAVDIKLELCHSQLVS